jgi:hypothetical protein
MAPPNNRCASDGIRSFLADRPMRQLYQGELFGSMETRLYLGAFGLSHRATGLYL